MCERVCIAVVDLQGFQSSGDEYVLKELYFSIFDYNNEIIENNTSRHYIFKQPFEWKHLERGYRANALWLSNFHHGFYWNDGDVNYSEIGNCITPLLRDKLIIFVKGSQKILWLKDLCRNIHLDVRNIEDFNCNIRLSEESYNLSNSLHCCKHRKIVSCARQNVEILKNWLRNNLRKKTIDEYDE